MSDMINHSPLKKALMLLGHTDLEDRMLYQDYLHQIVNGGGSSKPITEHQWEVMCDMLGRDRPIYASNVSSALRLSTERAKSAAKADEKYVQVATPED